MKISGELKKVAFQNDSGWGRFVVSHKVKSKYVDSTFTGVLPDPKIGMRYNFDGRYIDHEKYGKQFQFFSSSVSVSDYTSDGLVSLLSSERFLGIGSAKAKAIVNRFGNDTVRIIQSDPMQLTKIQGIGESIAKSIHDAMPYFGKWEELRILLHDSSDYTVNKIFQKYGDDSVFIIKDNPYILMDELDGFGFIKSDKIAKEIGIANNDPRRLSAAISYILQKIVDEGHCYMQLDSLHEKLLDFADDVSPKDLASVLKGMTSPKMKSRRIFIDEDGSVYPYHLCNAENAIAQKVKQFIQKSKYGIKKESFLHLVKGMERENGFHLDESQVNAAYKAICEKICVITGGPGTGKTTIVKTIIEAIKTQYPMINIALMAPTGRAARRMKEATGYPAKTIHSAIRINQNQDAEYSEQNPFPADFIIVDESSMIDIALAAALLKGLREDASIIFIGDIDQLPPVGAGTFFRDMLTTYLVPSVRLTFSHRQSGSIAQNATKMNRGIGFHAYTTDDAFQVITASKENAADNCIREYLSLVEEFGVENTILLSPSRSKGKCCTEQLNRIIQKKVNTKNLGGPHVERFHTVFYEGDRAMLLKNKVIPNHANGDCGTILKIQNGSITFRFDDESEHVIIDERLLQYFTLAYACTIHKSQGSEYDGVVLVFMKEHAFQGERALIYTGVTRSRKKCRLVCDPHAVEAALAKVKPVLRNGKLKLKIEKA